MTNQAVMRPCETEPAAEVYDEPSPFIIEFVMVQCGNFTTMAYRDKDGRWRGAFNNSELHGLVRVLE